MPFEGKNKQSGCISVHTLSLNLFWFKFSIQSSSEEVVQHVTCWLDNICPLFFANILQLYQTVRSSWPRPIFGLPVMLTNINVAWNFLLSFLSLKKKKKISKLKPTSDNCFQTEKKKLTLMIVAI